jgi:hypothetical protein
MFSQALSYEMSNTKTHRWQRFMGKKWYMLFVEEIKKWIQRTYLAVLLQ